MRGRQVYLCKAEEVDVDGSKGKANFVVKFKGAKHQVSAALAPCGHCIIRQD
jgi:Eukaryotic protein of unknown function (DUF866)